MSKRRLFDIIYMQSECLHKYCKRYNKTLQEGLSDFDNFNIFLYIFECYELLHLYGVDYIVKDIRKRIKDGVIF